MAILILCTIIGFFIIYQDPTWDDFDKHGLALSSGTLGFCVGVFLWVILGGIIGAELPTTEIVEKQEICALNDSSTIEGTNYLFSGYINEKLVYRYVINTDKGKHIEEVNAEDAYIKEGDYLLSPHVQITNYKFTHKWYYLFAHDGFLKTDTVFYVPQNTITTEYNIDLK